MVTNTGSITTVPFSRMFDLAIGKEAYGPINAAAHSTPCGMDKGGGCG